MHADADERGFGSTSETVVEERPSVARAETEKSQARSSAPKWEQAARKRLRDGVRQFSGPIRDLLDRDANEGDTRLLVTDILCEVLGYDKYTELTTEYRVRGQYADFGVRIDRELIAFIECKRIATTLNKRHLTQVQTYALNEGVEWIILTNGANWQAYHVTAAMPVEVEIALNIDLVNPSNQDLDHFFYLTRESLQRRQIDELWQARKATSTGSLRDVVLSDRVINAIRLELRSQTGHRAENDEISQLIRRKLLRPDVFEE